MNKHLGKITENRQLTNSAFILSCSAEKLAKVIKPGQFCNVKVNDSYLPLLRRPFSICDVKDDVISFMINIKGIGTEILSQKRIGDNLDILGPFGNYFGIDDEYDTAIIIAGGIGIAPFPFFVKNLKGRRIKAYFGFRNKDEVIDIGIKNALVSTNDGSYGIKGTVLDLLNNDLINFANEKSKIFACGPTAMLKAVQNFCLNKNIKGEISTESAMACGFGICQGCVIDTHDEDKYKLVCKDGPIFNITEVKL